MRLTCLVQGGNELGDEGAKFLCEALQFNASVQILDLVSYFLATFNIFFVWFQASCLFYMHVLQQHNLIGDEGAKFIGQALKVNTSLQTLSLVNHFSFCCF